MPDPKTSAYALALAFLAGPWTRRGLIERSREALGRRPKLLLPIVRLALRLFPVAPHGRAETLAKLLARSRAMRAAMAAPHSVAIRRWILPEPVMARPLTPFAALRLPALAAEAELAHFLGIHSADLDWYVDARRLNRATREERLRHYRHRWLAKRSGAYRLIEAPKRRLRIAQRRVLDGILSKVPTHDACHGHRAGRSVMSFVAPHVGKQVVLRLDLAEFFGSIRVARVRAIFASLGYPDRVAACLACLCTTPTPEDVLAARPVGPHATPRDTTLRWVQRQRLRDAHLPQGAPTSPALANLAAYRLDVRLSALSRRFAAQYTRYADDLAFSGGRELKRALPVLLPLVGGIVLEEGFELRYEKTRIMTASARQQLCGVVVNQAPCVSRRVYEQLEACLVNCARRGASTQNRDRVTDFEAHLRGRVAWVSQLHPTKGARLQRLFEEIDFAR